MLDTDGDIIFSRLYTHLEKRYKYQQPDGSYVHFFYLKFEKDGRTDVHCINFPYMASVLAELREDQRRRRADVWLARVAIVVASVSAVASVLGVLASM